LTHHYVFNGSAKIHRCNLDGSIVENLVTTDLSYPSGIALDVAADRMYWADWGYREIRRNTLNGSSTERLVTSTRNIKLRNMGDSAGLALDVAAGKMYLTHHYVFNGSAKIHRCNLDGSIVENLVTTDLSYPSGIALDVAADRMYWADWGYREIRRNTLNGSSTERLVTSTRNIKLRNMGDSAGLALDVAAGKMYWTDAGTSKIHRSDLDGSSVEDLVTTGITSPQGIALDVTVAQRSTTKYANKNTGSSESPFFLP